MRRAAGQPADGGEARRDVELRLDLATRVGIAHRNQRAGPLMTREVLDHLDGHQEMDGGGAGPFKLDRVIDDLAAYMDGALHERAEISRGGEDLIQGLAHDLPAAPAQQPFGAAPGHHQPVVTPEEEHGLLHAVEQLIEIRAHLVDVGLRAAKALAEQGEFRLDGGLFFRSRLVAAGFDGRLAARDAVDDGPDALQRPKCQVRCQDGDQQ